MFAKLNIDFIVDDYVYGTKRVEYGKNSPVLQYHNVFSEQCDQLLVKLIPERFQKDFIIKIMDVYANVVPHTDINTLSSINHYIQTNDEETIFYSFKEGIEIEYFQNQKQKSGYMFKESQLDIRGSFVATEKETWILDVSKPHCVKVSPPSTRLRKAIVIQTAIHKYEKVIEMLMEQNLL